MAAICFSWQKKQKLVVREVCLTHRNFSVTLHGYLEKYISKLECLLLLFYIFSLHWFLVSLIDEKCTDEIPMHNNCVTWNTTFTAPPIFQLMRMFHTTTILYHCTIHLVHDAPTPDWHWCKTLQASVSWPTASLG